MWLDKLEYRDSLDLPEDLTFGIEIEFANARRKYIEEELDNAYEKGIINSKWNLKYEETIFGNQETSYIKGGEATSDILHDNKKDWNNIKYACDTINFYGGTTNKYCGAHVHINGNFLKDNMKYYDRLIKLYTIYEDVIMRFWYGEDNKPRPNLNIFAGSPIIIFNTIRDYFYYNHKHNLTFDEFLSFMTGSRNKNLALSFSRLSKNFLESYYNITNNWKQYRTLEFRGAMGTTKPVIWQNYINLPAKLVLCCMDDKKDWKKINRLYEKTIHGINNNKYNCNKAIDFADFIFNNDLDKKNFMLQYIKDEEDVKVRKKTKY
ncbi:MAG: amidoligase family protein [Bacilli bacterium]|nr:amidoligase family protein [Bacilli bacterium]